MPVTGEQIIQDILHPFIATLDNEGLSLEYLARKLKKELNAKKIDTFKAKKVEKDIASGVITETEEVIYSVPMVDWKIRQVARKEALAYRGIIAVEKKELTGKDGAPLIPKIEVEFVRASGSKGSDS
jgi:hypothetical protein